MKIRHIAVLKAWRLLCTRLESRQRLRHEDWENEEGEKHRRKEKRRKLRKYVHKDEKERKSR
jgi:hypothetical protein